MDKGLGVMRQPGYTQYRGDGNGRDSYIMVGNAGLVKQDAFKNLAPQTGYTGPISSSGALFHG